MNLSPIRILQIDDDCDDAEIVQEALRGCHDADYRVTHVPSLSRASDALRCASFDVILLDLGLPESTGTQTLMRFMEGFDQTAPVIVLTGASNDDAALELLDLGAQDYLVKSDV